MIMEVEGLTTCDMFLRSTLEVLVTYWFIGVEGKGEERIEGDSRVSTWGN